MGTKRSIIEGKLLPFFKSKKLNEITAKDVIKWQGELLAYEDEDGDPYSQTYLKTIHNQLSAIFNHAVRYVPLHSAPFGLKCSRFCGEDIYTTNTSERLVRLPMYMDMTNKDAEYVSELIHSFYKGK